MVKVKIQEEGILTIDWIKNDGCQREFLHTSQFYLTTVAEELLEGQRLGDILKKL